MKYDKYSSNEDDHMYMFFDFCKIRLLLLYVSTKTSGKRRLICTVSSVLDKLFVIIKTVYFEFSTTNLSQLINVTPSCFPGGRRIRIFLDDTLR